MDATEIISRLARLEELQELHLAKTTRIEEIMQQLFDGFTQLKNSPMLSALLPQPRKGKN
jgi:hypothetical protein